MPKSREEWMRQAIDLAVENVRAGSGGPFAALVVKNSDLISTGLNSVTASNDPTAHAEIVAIRRACQALGDFQLHDCELYATSEPCPMCVGAIYWARPKAYYFAYTRIQAAEAGFDDAFIYDQLQLPPNKRAIPTHQVQTAVGSDPFAEWDREPSQNSLLTHCRPRSD